MRPYFLFIYLFFIINHSAQVGINSLNEAAMMEIKSSNKVIPNNLDGILIPKIDIFPLINPTINQDSMLIFLTTESNGKQPGFYYWQNQSSSWTSVGGREGWDTSGDNISNIDIIGTNNNKDLNFKRINLSSGFIGISNTSFGEESLKPTSSGLNNSGLGSYSLNGIINGSENTGVGRSSLRQNPNGSFNCALGAAALYGGISGNENVALGMFSLYTSRGSQNVGIGNNALFTLTTTGDLNTSMGYKSSFFQLSGNKNFVIGPNTDPIVNTDSEQLNIMKTIYGGDIDSTSSRIGIGEAYPQTKLEINGAITLKTLGGTENASNLILVGNRSYIKINNPTSIGGLSLSNGLSEGQLLFIQYDGTPGVCPINNTVNINIAVPFSINGGDMLQFIWDGTNWLLASFSDNN